eukprot:scaffold42410_cov20-Cyclotella_meneghiniana.AAC.1
MEGAAAQCTPRRPRFLAATGSHRGAREGRTAASVITVMGMMRERFDGGHVDDRSYCARG